MEKVYYHKADKEFYIDFQGYQVLVTPCQGSNLFKLHHVNEAEYFKRKLKSR